MTTLSKSGKNDHGMAKEGCIHPSANRFGRRSFGRGCGIGAYRQLAIGLAASASYMFYSSDCDRKCGAFTRSETAR
jgi:hypothetical protein